MYTVYFFRVQFADWYFFAPAIRRSLYFPVSGDGAK